MHPGGFREYWVLQRVNLGLLRAVKESDADGWSTCGCRDLHLFYMHFSIIPTCSSDRGTFSSRARSLPRLQRRKEERECLERPDVGANINGTQAWVNWTSTKARYLLFQPLILFCIRTPAQGPKLCKDCVSCLKHTFTIHTCTLSIQHCVTKDDKHQQN